ncbi:hypothetical protein Q1695_012584 [Nippostrongylus brasiliensis]|nr:hypothetical protein Q1695_012584 [Nippostrongylus brasiliensis]
MEEIGGQLREEVTQYVAPTTVSRVSHQSNMEWNGPVNTGFDGANMRTAAIANDEVAQEEKPYMYESYAYHREEFNPP